MLQNGKNYNFVARTQKLVKQYDSFKLHDKEKLDVTLLLNACVGLLVIVQEKHKNEIPQIDADGLDEIIAATTKCAYRDKSSGEITDETKNINSICRHLRNSIAHTNFSVEFENNYAKRIKFSDYPNSSRKEDELTFNATIDVEVLKRFLISLSQHIIDAKI